MSEPLNETDLEPPKRGRRLERWMLFLVVVVLSVWMGAMSLYLITEGNRRCHAINRANKGNLAAWDFMQETVRAGWCSSQGEPQPGCTNPSPQTKATVSAFFAGIHERLRPISC